MKSSRNMGKNVMDKGETNNSSKQAPARADIKKNASTRRNDGVTPPESPHIAKSLNFPNCQLPPRKSHLSSSKKATPSTRPASRQPPPPVSNKEPNSLPSPYRPPPPPNRTASPSRPKANKTDSLARTRPPWIFAHILITQPRHARRVISSSTKTSPT